MGRHMSGFRSALLVCMSFLTVFFFGLDFIRKYFRYEFLVKGDICIAFDHQESSLKVIGPSGCATVPLNKTDEQKMREQIEQEVNQKLQTSLNQLVSAQANAVLNDPKKLKNKTNGKRESEKEDSSESMLSN